MKIKNVYISAFGALKDLSLDLSDGLQVLYGKNEAGKTTICEFIKAMFYGSRKVAGKAQSAREKYAPADGSAAAGRITFEHSGRDFCLERQFRKSDATDKVTITDLATGKSEPAPADIGKVLFGISLPAFERSVFIGNTPSFSPDENAKGELNQKLADTALTGEDNVSYKKVLDRIDSARLKLVSKSGKTGSLVGDIAKCNELSELLAESDRMSRKKQEIISALKDLDSRLSSAEKEFNNTQKVLDSAKDIENKNKLGEYLREKENLDRITAELTLPDGTVADEMFLKKFEFAFSKLDNMKAKAENSAMEAQRLEKAIADRADSSPEEIKEKIAESREKLDINAQKCQKIKAETESINGEIDILKAEAERAENAKKSANIPLLTVAAALLAGIGIYFISKSLLLSGAIVSAGILLLILSFIFKPRDTKRKRELENRLSLKTAELSGKSAELTAANSERESLEAKIENLTVALNIGEGDRKRLDDTLLRQESELRAVEEEKIKILNFFSMPLDTDLEALKVKAGSLYSKAEEQKQIKIRLGYLSRDLGGISYEQAREKLDSADKTFADLDIGLQKQKAKALLDSITELKTEKARYETELKTAFGNIRDPEDLRREIAEIKERVAAKQEFYESAGIAYGVLEESLLAARQTFGSALEQETLKNFKELTLGAYRGIKVSQDFDIRAERQDTFGMTEAERLSRGTKDQAYLALRLAVSRLISQKEALPLVLDDALSQYDDERFCAALEFLRDYAKDGQALLFTCHDFVVNEARKNGIKTISL